jgi:DNA-binding transcriptional ArsR family regulator
MSGEAREPHGVMGDAMPEATHEERVRAVRRFNRLYTRRIGAPREGLAHTPYALTEARIIFELVQRDDLTASDLCHTLGLDAGYLSRPLAGLEQHGLIERPRRDGARARSPQRTDAGISASWYYARRVGGIDGQA